jgi:hypothetical protein
LDSVGDTIGVQEGDLSPWYEMDRRKLSKFRGIENLLPRYKNSIFTMLNAIYPDYDWVPWKFKNPPSNNLRRDPEMIRKALDYIETETGIKSPKEWFSVTESILKNLGVYALVSRSGGLIHLLHLYRPDTTLTTVADVEHLTVRQ